MTSPLRTLALAAATLTLAGLAWAQAASPADGEVRKIDKAQAKITLKHGEIKNLDMPPMTMVFRVRNAALLDAVAVGDKVKFSAAKVDGDYVVTEIKKAP
jgi:Cu(I)/Ag(I) efflux system periplasmic protein CusF